MGIEVGTAMILSSALSAGSALYSGYQANEQGKFAEQQANADADAAKAAGRVEAGRIRAITDRQRASSRAALAGAGVSVDMGTATDVQRDIVQAGEQDAMTAILNGGNTATRLRAEGAGMRRQGQQAMVGSVLSAGGAIASGAAGYGRWQRMQATGVTA